MVHMLLTGCTGCTVRVYQEDVPGLRLIERDIGILMGLIVTSGSRLNKIDRILIPSSYTFFFGNSTEKKSRVKRA
jgi:hypothetical protein